MAEAAAFSISPASYPEGFAIKGEICSRTVASSSSPSWILVARSRDTDQLSTGA